ncbi:hypothetical protein ACP0HM_09815 [Escherichia coli]
MFRSLDVPHYYGTLKPVNVPWWLNRHHPGQPGLPGGKSRWRGSLILFLSAIG